MKFGRLDDYTKQTVTFDSGDHTSVTVYTGDWPNGDTWIQLDDYSLVAVDDVAPVVTLNGEAEVTLKLGGTFTDPGAKAIDDIDGDISRRIVVTGSVDTGKSGTYTLTYSAADAERNTGAAVRTATVLDPVLPEGIGLDREELALEVGSTATLTAAVSPEDADDKRVVWTSHRPAVATVSAAGEVRGVSEGTAIVTATTALGGYTAIAVVSVKPAVGPAAPQWPEGAALTASEIGQTGLKLSWPAASGESPTVAYAVYGGDSLIGETSVSSTVYQVTGLTAGTSYSFTVKAINEAGKWSEGLSASVSTVSSDPGGVGGNPGGANGGTAPDGGTPQVTDGTIAVKARPDAEGNVVVGLSADVIKRAIAGVKDGRLRIKIDVGAETASSTGMAGAAGATSSTGTAGAAGATSSTGMAGSTSLAGSTGASGTEDSTSLARAIRSIKVQLPLADIVDAGVGEVEVDAGGASVMLRTDVSAGVLAKDAKRLELTIAKADVAALPAESRERIGDRPVYELGLAVDGANPASFGSSGAVRVALDYAPTAGERPGKLVIYFVGDDGKLQPVKRTAYDAVSGTIVFEPQHFSRYAVGYADVAFSDLAGAAWAQEMIESLTARQIIGGTGGERFEPGRAVTRAEFLQLLLNALDLKDASATADFRDVATDSWYYGAVAAGAKLGIAQGRGDGTFGAGDTITREDMAVMLSRTTALKGWKGRGLMAALPVSFTDESNISGYAAGAVNDLVQAGLINGFTDGTFAPRAETTRAQAAAVIYRLLAPR
ncbi:S-layer homology domain-containing protein [Cohnella rhizosphaerae]|uniref:S-layer homology domain-containing protein n=1 Tax=Cohnella rhizosphaerae TaxID=1457232 RepID=A0A9X4KZE0_9BACL|nr:S-layer homology domain-containing protein [Cohnella rhizosphaerae]MDG0814114.1 S-layer homology domain-containing protein [Cohnella rhizosphaerae]